MKKMTALLLLFTVLFAGCGEVEETVHETAVPGASVTEQSHDDGGKTVTHVMTAVHGTTFSLSAAEDKYGTETKADEPSPPEDMSDTADTFTEAFLSSVTSAEFRDFDETRWLIDGSSLETVKAELRACHGKKCEDPGIDGWYSFVLKDNSGNEHFLSLTGNYAAFAGSFYYDPETDKGAELAEFFRSKGKRLSREGEELPEGVTEMTARFEFVQLSPGGSSAYAVSDTFGLVNFPVNDDNIRKLPSGTMLDITWSGMIAEVYPGLLEGVTKVSRANDLADPDRPDFVSEHLAELTETCRGMEDYYPEIDKLTGLKKGEKDALYWLVGNALAE